jgi:hypothetical protein
VVLQCLVVVIVIVVGGVLHDDGVIAFADFSPLFVLGLPFLRDLDPTWGRLGSEMNFFKSSCKGTRHQQVYTKQGLLD